MRLSRFAATAAAASVLLIALAGCAAPGPVVAPVVVSVGDLQGATVEVPLNSVLDIDTGSLDVDSYTADIADASVAEFTQGNTDGSATFNPAITPKKVGETKVTLSNKDGGIQDVDFTLKVTPAG